MKSLTLRDVERAIESWKPQDRRALLSRLAKRYENDIRENLGEEDLEKLGWMMVARSSLGFWDNEKDAAYDRM